MKSLKHFNLYPPATLTLVLVTCMLTMETVVFKDKQRLILGLSLIQEIYSRKKLEIIELSSITEIILLTLPKKNVHISTMKKAVYMVVH